jgi:hypothetical protein
VRRPGVPLRPPGASPGRTTRRGAPRSAAGWRRLAPAPPFAGLAHPHPPPRHWLAQISRALLGDDQRLRLPRFLEDEQIKDPEATKQDLIEKIAQLNSSIDEVAAQLKTKEAEAETIAA